MENNQISMFMDVKLDINERRTEALKFKSWTKCLVKIEAIKCFPCYVRITFTKDLQNDNNEGSIDFCVRINVPGLTIRQAISRTKQYSYGIFWKHNRKRCCIFFALDSHNSYEMHMKWLRKSVKTLEIDRQEFIETRRNSKYVLDNNIKVITNLDDQQSCSSKANLQDILGPLPKVPDLSESNNWSQRISGLSGIYEEIPDTFEQYQQQNKRNSRRVSRASVASGIYEEMRPPIQQQQIQNFEAICELENRIVEGPPLPPPRKRVNTLESDTSNGTIPRCNTNPEEAEMTKKKKYLQVFGRTVFGRSKRERCESVSECKVTTEDDLITRTPPPSSSAINAKNANTLQSHNYSSGNSMNSNNSAGSGNGITPKVKCKTSKIFDFNKITLPMAMMKCKKRNSFSSPDLTNLANLNDDGDDDEFEDILRLDSLSLEYEDTDVTLELNANAVVHVTSLKDNDNDHCNQQNTDLPFQSQNDDLFCALKYSTNDDDTDNGTVTGIPSTNTTIAALNISEQIQPNFNFSCNSSTINLVGANLISNSILINEKQLEIQLIDDLSGYCTMAPIKNQKLKLKDGQKNNHDYNVDGSYKSDHINNEIKGMNLSNNTDVYENMNPIADLIILKNHNDDENNDRMKITQDCKNDDQQNIIYQNVLLSDHCERNDELSVGKIDSNCANDDTKSSEESINEKNEISVTENFSSDLYSIIIRRDLNRDNDNKSHTLRRSRNFDEKIPSYYPNDCDMNKSNRRLGTLTSSVLSKQSSNNNRNDDNIKNCGDIHSLNFKPNHNHTKIVSSSCNTKMNDFKIKNSHQEHQINNDFHIKSLSSTSSSASLKLHKTENNLYQVQKPPTSDSVPSKSSSVIRTPTKSNDGKKIHSSPLSSPLSSPIKQQNSIKLCAKNLKQNYDNTCKKYATLARLSPSKYLLDRSPSNNKNIATAITTADTIAITTPNTVTDLNSVKKFASLPRLKKLDFSPLKLKINAVLQRHQSDGFQAQT